MNEPTNPSPHHDPRVFFLVKASLQSISAAVRYIECLRLDTFSEIVGKDLHQAGTSPLSRDSTNVVMLSDDAMTLILRGADAYDDDLDNTDDVDFDNFALEGVGIRWRRSAEYIEGETDLSTDQVIRIVEKATGLIERIRVAAENSPSFREKIRAAAQEGLWHVWINGETEDVSPTPGF